MSRTGTVAFSSSLRFQRASVVQVSLPRDAPLVLERVTDRYHRSGTDDQFLHQLVLRRPQEDARLGLSLIFRRLLCRPDSFSGGACHCVPTVHV
jgi:hypothetical protein